MAEKQKVGRILRPACNTVRVMDIERPKDAILPEQRGRRHPIVLGEMINAFESYRKHIALANYHHPTMGTTFQKYHRAAVELLEAEFPRFRETYDRTQNT